MELYRDQAAVDEHPKTRHFTELFPAVRELLVPGPPDFEFVDSVGLGIPSPIGEELRTLNASFSPGRGQRHL